MQSHDETGDQTVRKLKEFKQKWSKSSKFAKDQMSVTYHEIKILR